MSDSFLHDDAAAWPPLASDQVHVGAPLASDLPPSGPPPFMGFDTGASVPTPPPPSHPVRFHHVVARVALCALLMVAGVAIGHLAWSTTTRPASVEPGFSFPNIEGPGNGRFTIPSGFGSFPNFENPSSTAPSNGGPSDASAIAKKIDPALVDINATFNYQSAAGEGTGIVITSNGEVITNNHVVNGETSLSVVDVGNGKTYTAKVVGYDDSKDIAVIQLIGASGLTTASLGDSSTAKVGEKVVAVGNAGGIGGTPTAAGGEITGLDQSVTASDELDGTNEHLNGLLGVSADVQPGDSGGSLVDTSGQVLGIDTAGSSSSSFDIQGQSSTATQAFAIPIDEALSIAAVIESGTGTSSIHVGRTAFLGVFISTSNQSSRGIEVQRVVAGGAAAAAGLAGGDMITKFDGVAMATPDDLTAALVPLHPGDKVSISWTDPSGHSHTATTTLAVGPPA